MLSSSKINSLKKFDEVIKDKDLFKAYLEKSKAYGESQHVLFYMSTEPVQVIYDKYIAKNSKLEINIRESLREKFKALYMTLDWKSSLWKDYIRLAKSEVNTMLMNPDGILRMIRNDIEREAEKVMSEGQQKFFVILDNSVKDFNKFKPIFEKSLEEKNYLLKIKEGIEKEIKDLESKKLIAKKNKDTENIKLIDNDLKAINSKLKVEERKFKDKSTEVSKLEKEYANKLKEINSNRDKFMKSPGWEKQAKRFNEICSFKP